MVLVLQCGLVALAQHSGGQTPAQTGLFGHLIQSQHRHLRAQRVAAASQKQRLFAVVAGLAATFQVFRQQQLGGGVQLQVTDSSGWHHQNMALLGRSAWLTEDS